MLAEHAPVLPHYRYTPHWLNHFKKKVKTVETFRTTCLATLTVKYLPECVFLTVQLYWFAVSLFVPAWFSKTALHVTAKTMRLRMRKASQQSNPSLASRPSRTKRRHSEVEEEEDTPTSGGRGLFSTIKKFIRGNAVKVTTSVITSNDPAFSASSMPVWLWCPFWKHWNIIAEVVLLLSVCLV